MNITKVSVRQVDMNKVKAIASITIDDDFVVHDLRVVEGERGLFVAMPSRKLPSGNFRDVAHPINSETREMIQNVVLEEYRRFLETSQGREVSQGTSSESSKISDEEFSSTSNDILSEPPEPDESSEA
jgi:stage V sporulation protein G